MKMTQGLDGATATRQHIIEAAGLQFGKDGYEGSSFGRIAEAMGRPKSAIGYHVFPSKRELADAVIRHQQLRWKTILDSLAMEDGVDRLVTFLLTCAFDARECPVARGAMRLLREFAQNGTPRPRNFVWSTIVSEQLQAAARAGEMDPGAISAGSVSLVLNATFGLIDGSRSEGDEALERQLRALWVPLLASFGLTHANERVAALHPQAVPPIAGAATHGPDGDDGQASDADPATVRQWAAANGYKVSSKGRISRSIHDAYNLAH